MTNAIKDIQIKKISLAIILFGFVTRGIFAMYLPFTSDEAHYVLYGINLDWSYFDHPPMVGWLQSIILLFSANEWALRLMPNLLHMLSVLLLLSIAQTVYSDRLTPLISVILFESSLVLQLMGVVLLPDAPLILFTLASILFFNRAIKTNNWLDWLLLGSSLGLMGLSKYTAILIPIGYACWLTHHSRQTLLNPRLWLALIVGVVMISPVIIWNIDNEWISILYQLKHGEVGNNNLAWDDLIKTQVVNLISYGLIISLGVWLLVIGHTKQLLIHYLQIITKRTNTESPKLEGKTPDLLFWLIVPYLVVFAYSGAKGGHYLPHWVAVPMVLALPWIASKLVVIFDKQAKANKMTTLVKGFLLTITIMPFLLFALVVTGNIPKESNKKVWQGIVGWKEGALKAKQLSSAEFETPVIYVANWTEASLVSWYARPVIVLPLDNGIDQFDIWYKNKQLTKPLKQRESKFRSGILLSTLDHEELKKAQRYFENCKLVEHFTVNKYNNTYQYGLWKCLT